MIRVSRKLTCYLLLNLFLSYINVMSENEEVGYKSLFTATGFSYYVFVSAVEFISRECY